MIGEGLGLAATLCMLGLFTLLAYADSRVAADSKDLFVQSTAGAVTTQLSVHTLVNIGAVIGLVPITGIPLPLIRHHDHEPRRPTSRRGSPRYRTVLADSDTAIVT